MLYEPSKKCWLVPVGREMMTGDLPVGNTHVGDPTRLAQEAALWYAEYSTPYLAEPVKPDLKAPRCFMWVD